MRTVLLLFMILLTIFVTGCSNNGNSGVYPDTISCIADHSEIYINVGCIACVRQAELFGEDFKDLNVINCNEEPQRCLDANIYAVPTWIIFGKRVEGVMSIEKIKEMTGCA